MCLSCVMAAFALAQDTESAVYSSLERHYADLLEARIDPITVAAELCSAGILSRHSRDEIFNDLMLSEQKVSELLAAVIGKKIRLDPSSYHKFVEALEKDSSMQHLCDKLRSTCVNHLTSKEKELLEALEQTRKITQGKDVHISILEKHIELLEQKLVCKPTDVSCTSDPVSKPIQYYLDMAPSDILNGMNVHGETVLEIVGSKPQKLEWPGCGFCIEVPGGALSPGETASVTVKVVAGGQFQFPENRQLISAIYWVSSNVLFEKEVSVNIEHCAVIKNEEECSLFRFIVAKSSQDSYRFKEREGVFNPHTQYGTFKLKQFLLIGETAPDDTEVQCTALMFYKQQMASPLVADFHFVVVKDLEPFLQEVHKEYQGWSKDSHTLSVCFNGKTTVLLDQQEQVVDSWKILPLSFPRITNNFVSYFTPGRTIPHCAFELRLLPGKPPQRLLHKVDIVGVSSLNSSFYIRYPQPEDNKVLQAGSSYTNSFDLVSLSQLQSEDQRTVHGGAVVTTTHSIHCGSTSGSHELPPAEGAPPTLLKLKTMKGADGKPLKIIPTIAVHDFTTFGMCLLQDENGEVVALLKRDHIHDGAESVTEAILQKWLTSGAPTRTYQHLIKCLRQSELGALAELITTIGQANRPTYNQLIQIDKADGSKLKVIQWITSLERWQCSDFAHKLLINDVLVSKFENEYKEKNEFVRKVLKYWLSRNDDDATAVPRTWAALAKCVTDAGLPGTLSFFEEIFPQAIG